MEAAIASPTEIMASLTSSSDMTAVSDAKAGQESTDAVIKSDESGSQPDITTDTCVDTIQQTDGQIDMSDNDRVSRYERDRLGRVKRRYSSCDRRRHSPGKHKRPVRKCKSQGAVRRPRSSRKQGNSVEKSEIDLTPTYTTDETDAVSGSETDDKLLVSELGVDDESLSLDSDRSQGDSSTAHGPSDLARTEAPLVATCDTPSTYLCSKATSLSEQVHDDYAQPPLPTLCLETTGIQGEVYGDCIQSTVPSLSTLSPNATGLSAQVHGDSIQYEVPPLSTLCSKVTGPSEQVHGDYIQSTVPPLSALCLTTISLLGQINDDYVQSLVSACVNDNTSIDNGDQKRVNTQNNTSDPVSAVDKISCDLRDKLASDDSLPDKVLESASKQDLIQMYNDKEMESKAQFQQRVDSVLQELRQQEGQIESIMKEGHNIQAEPDAHNTYGEAIGVQDNFEITKYKITSKEQTLSTSVMKHQNDDLIVQVTDLIEDINEIKLRRLISGEAKTNQFTIKADQLEADTEVSKAELDGIMNKLNTLKMNMTNQGVAFHRTSLTESFDESARLHDRLKIVISPPLSRRSDAQSLDILPLQSLLEIKPPCDGLKHGSKKREWSAMNPHDILRSKDGAMSLLHWLRCCQPRFALMTAIPGPEYFLPHGTIRYSERYTVSIKNPTYLQLNQQYNKHDWMPSKNKVHERQYISGKVCPKIVDRLELATSRLGWLQCCRVELEMPKSDILVLIPLNNSSTSTDDTVTCSDTTNEPRYGFEPHGDPMKQAKQPQDDLTTNVDVPKANVKSGDQIAKPDTKSNKDVHLAQGQTIETGGTVVRNKKRKKAITSKVDTGLSSETQRFPGKKSEGNVKISASVPVARKKRKAVNIEVKHIQAKVKNAKSRIDTGLASNTRRLPPVKATKANGNLQKVAAGQRPNSTDQVPLSPHHILPPIKGRNSLRRNDPSGDRITDVKQSNTNILPPIKPTQPVKVPNISNSKMAIRKATKVPEIKLPKPTNGTSAQIKNKSVPSTVQNAQKQAKQYQRTEKKAAMRNCQLPPLKKCPKTPVRVEISRSHKTSLSPLPAIGKSTIDVNKAYDFGHINERSISSSSGFCVDLLRDDYY